MAVTPTTVSIPAAAHAVEVLRSVTGAVAARTPLGFEQVDDLRLAVTEAAVRLIGAGDGRGSIREEIAVAADGIEIRLLLADAMQTRWPPPPDDHPFSWTVIVALVDEAWETLDEGQPCIELRLRITGR